MLAIANARLMPDITRISTKDGCLELTELADLIDRRRTDTVEQLVKKYRTITPLLGKIEEVVMGSNSGKAPALAGYYHYWERAVFTALNTAILKAMTTLLDWMTPSKGGQPQTLFKVRRKLILRWFTLQNAWPVASPR